MAQTTPSGNGAAHGRGRLRQAGRPYRSPMSAGSCLLSFCCASSPHRLVVRTSRCGRDSPGSNPGVDTLVGWQCCPCLASCCVLPVRWLWARAHPVSTVPGIEVWCHGAGSTVRQWRSAWQGPAAPGRPPYRSTMPAGSYLLRFCCASSPHLVVRTSRCGRQAASTGHPCQWANTSLPLPAPQVHIV